MKMTWNATPGLYAHVDSPRLNLNKLDLEQNETQSACAESAHKGVS